MVWCGVGWHLPPPRRNGFRPLFFCGENQPLHALSFLFPGGGDTSTTMGPPPSAAAQDKLRGNGRGKPPVMISKSGGKKYDCHPTPPLSKKKHHFFPWSGGRAGVAVGNGSENGPLGDEGGLAGYAWPQNSMPPPNYHRSPHATACSTSPPLPNGLRPAHW